MVNQLGNDNTTAGVVLAALIAVVLVLYFLKSKKSRSDNRRMPHENGDDKEKVSMSAKIDALEKVNADLRERLRGLELEYLEKQDSITGGKEELDRKTMELDEGLKEVYALKEMINEYRVKVTRFKKDKDALEAKVGELTAIVQAGRKKFEGEMEPEFKKIDEEKEEIKREAKEMVVAFKGKTADKISALEEENRKFKDQIAKFKEMYGAWESIEGL